MRWQPTQETWRDNLNNPDVKDLKGEGCRPASLLRYLYDVSWGHNGTSGAGGMCAQGHSGGATAIAYALAWYGAGSDSPATGYLDNVVLTSGPAQADVELGCRYDPGIRPSPVSVCLQNQCKDNAPSWSDCAQYDNGIGPNFLDCMNRRVDNENAAFSVAQYTMGSGHSGYPPNCNNANNDPATNTSPFNSQWKSMSVVSTDAHYDYPRTSVSGFVCATGHTQADLPNNSAAQAWQYLQNVQVGPGINFGIYRVEGCRGSEDIWGTSARVYRAGGGGDFGFNVSSGNMIADCIKRH